MKFPKGWPYYVDNEGNIIHPSEVVTEENEMTSDKERDEILSKYGKTEIEERHERENKINIENIKTVIDSHKESIRKFNKRLTNWPTTEQDMEYLKGQITAHENTIKSLEIGLKNKERDEILSKQVIKAELKGGYITDEEADIKLRELEDNHKKEESPQHIHFNDKYFSTRPILPERWDLLPAIALRKVAEIMYRGQDKHPKEDWKEINFNSEQSPLNRAIAHAYRATEMAPHSKERTRLLAKATCRLLMQIWWELQVEVAEKDYNPFKGIKEENKDENNN